MLIQTQGGEIVNDFSNDFLVRLDLKTSGKREIHSRTRARD